MSDDLPDSWLDALLRDAPVPEVFLERLQSLAREGKPVPQWSDAEIDALLVKVEFPAGAVERLRAICRAPARRRLKDRALDRLLGDVPIPEGLTESLHRAIEEESLDEALQKVALPVSVVPKIRIVPHVRRRLHPVWRGAAAALLAVAVAASYWGGVAIVATLDRPAERAATSPLAIDLGPLDLERTPAYDSPQLVGDEDRGPAIDDSREGDIALETVDYSPRYGPAGQMALAFDRGFHPFQNTALAVWKPFGAQWTEDNLPNLDTVLANESPGIEPPLAPGFDRLFLFKHGRFPIVDPSSDPALATSTTPVSTSSASYDLAERLAAEGRSPDPEEIRVEDFLAALDYGFPLPGPDEIKIRTAAGPSIFGSIERGLRPQLLQVAAQAGPFASREASPTHLTVAIDISASMKWNGRMEMAQRALARLLDHLGPNDRLSLVAFNEEIVYLADDATRTDREKLVAAIERLRPFGGTNISVGLREAAAVSLSATLEPGASRRVVLLTDGRVGLPPADAEQIETFVATAAREGLRLDVIDLSQQEDFPDSMKRLAAAGGGTARRGDTTDGIRWELVDCLVGSSPVIASAAMLHVKFNPATVAGYRLLGFEPAMAGATPAGARGGELRNLQAATALYEVWLLPNDVDDVATAEMTWIDPRTGESRRQEQRISRLQFAPSLAEAPLSLQGAAIAAQTAETLRDSRGASNSNRNLQAVLAAAGDVNPQLARQDSFRRFVALVRQLDENQTRRGP